MRDADLLCAQSVAREEFKGQLTERREAVLRAADEHAHLPPEDLAQMAAAWETFALTASAPPPPPPPPKAGVPRQGCAPRIPR